MKKENIEKIKTATIIVLLLVIVFGASYFTSELKGSDNSTTTTSESNNSSNDTSSNSDIPEDEQADMTEIDIDEYLEVKRMLGSYKAISVREASAQQIVESMGYKATHLLDPTFMLNKEDWEKYQSRRLVKVPYLLVYLPYNIHNKQLIYKTARKVADEKGLMVVTFSWSIRPEKLADKTIYFANPGDFLSLVGFADYIVTNSFHGTAFSINLNKQFSVYLPTGFGTRITSILELCSLTHRLLTAEEIISKEKMNEVIDYNPVNDILNEERMRTYAFLNKALNN